MSEGIVKRKRVRAPVISISVPQVGVEPVVRLVVEELHVEEGRIVQTIPGRAEVFRPLSQFAQTTFTATCPLTGQPMQLSGLQLAVFIEAAAARFMADHFGVEPDPANLVWVI